MNKGWNLVLSNKTFKVNNFWPGRHHHSLCRFYVDLAPLIAYCDRETQLSKVIYYLLIDMPRLVRRQPLRERIMAALNPMDFLLWLSEELETRDWDSATAGTQMGLAMNFVFLLARANSGSSTKSDDIFSDETSSGWLSFLVSSLLFGLLS